MFISSTSVPVGKFVAKTLAQDLKKQEHAFCPKAKVTALNSQIA